MSRKYLEDKIKDALVLASGNSAKAQKLLIQWAMSDAKLLQQLSKPHLKGITAHAVGRVITQMDRDDEPLPEEPVAIDMGPSSFGKSLLGAMSGHDTAHFGHENAAPRHKKKQASQQHINAIHQIARKVPKSDDKS
ncbi:MAG: hypothetical protein VYC19_05380 [Pseudomonadota bacterium]|nr:hypothetical protein [Alphaproteobacteria bacterium]MEC7702166.1 hypothetical protein [Pseudomonadota bacterium]